MPLFEQVIEEWLR